MHRCWDGHGTYGPTEGQTLGLQHCSMLTGRRQCIIIHWCCQGERVISKWFCASVSGAEVMTSSSHLSTWLFATIFTLYQLLLAAWEVHMSDIAEFGISSDVHFEQKSSLLSADLHFLHVNCLHATAVGDQSRQPAPQQTINELSCIRKKFLICLRVVMGISYFKTTCSLTTTTFKAILK